MDLLLVWLQTLLQTPIFSSLSPASTSKAIVNATHSPDSALTTRMHKPQHLPPLLRLNLHPTDLYHPEEKRRFSEDHGWWKFLEFSVMLGFTHVTAFGSGLNTEFWTH
ncbi:hypothetical protein BDP27DRAFT_741810 [Rhodocollybia butyracea]|uniref:Uncharacterized protein n=1 Tax=Rhodocollybia butyracea TaxID=206335 RepID=A0A9P5P6A5_9AGAR|nr:hypothetical protein BDP27DRAFT_741810 [Rhodocollybia butyracea]